MDRPDWASVPPPLPRNWAIDLGILVALERAYPKALFSRPIFDAAYGEDDTPSA
jgi:hypothetical protein